MAFSRSVLVVLEETSLQTRYIGNIGQLAFERGDHKTWFEKLKERARFIEGLLDCALAVDPNLSGPLHESIVKFVELATNALQHATPENPRPLLDLLMGPNQFSDEDALQHLIRQFENI